MGLRQYVNNFQKELQIGSNSNGVKFRGGFYETEDPKRQELIETNDAFGVSIHFMDSVEEMERIGKVRQETEGADKARKRKEFLAEMEAEDKAEADRKEKAAAELDAADKKKTINKKHAAASKVL